MNFNFVASDNFNLNTFKSIHKFVNEYPDFQTVILTDENELKLFLEIIGVKELEGNELNNTVYKKYWDISDYKFPEFNSEQYEVFYKEWIQKTNRTNDQNTYGNLMFLQGLTTKWNRLKYRLVIKEE